MTQPKRLFIKSFLLRLVWRFGRLLHHIDFRWLLPGVAALPLGLGYRMAKARGVLNAFFGRDWRSMALGFRHIFRQSLLGYMALFPSASQQELSRWRAQRFIAEARDEYEGALLARRRIHQLYCSFMPASAATVCANNSKGLLLLTPHYESFCLGMAFLAKGGGVVNGMSSRVTQDERVDPAVRKHFEEKYEGAKSYFNGGKVLDMEDGMKPFAGMLARGEVLMALADAPASVGGVKLSVNFLGQRRQLAGGNIRLAAKMNSDLGGFVCHCVGIGKYELTMSEIGPASDSQVIQHVYDFFSDAILKNPGGWWSGDLLPAMDLPVSP